MEGLRIFWMFYMDVTGQNLKWELGLCLKCGFVRFQGLPSALNPQP